MKTRSFRDHNHNSICNSKNRIAGASAHQQHGNQEQQEPKKQLRSKRQQQRQQQQLQHENEPPDLVDSCSIGASARRRWPVLRDGAKRGTVPAGQGGSDSRETEVCGLYRLTNYSGFCISGL